MFSTIINFIIAVYTFPVKTWQGGCSDGTEVVGTGWFGPECAGGGHYRSPEKVIGFASGALIYGITALLVILIVSLLWNQISWWRNRQACQHCTTWTRDMSDGSEPGCTSGQACCCDCVEAHIDAAVERRAEAEPRINCPSCGHEMEKVIDHRLILDICDQCGAVFLGPDELEHLEELATQRGYDNGYEGGQTAGMSSGLAMAFVIGSAVS